jgi:hypothetical protein
MVEGTFVIAAAGDWALDKLDESQPIRVRIMHMQNIRSTLFIIALSYPYLQVEKSEARVSKI